MGVKMKIAYFSNGESIHDQRYFDKFIQAGYEVNLISFQKDLLGVRQKSKLPELKGINVYNLQLDRFAESSIFYRIRNTIRVVIYSKRVLKKIKPDIICGCFIIDKYGFIAALTNFHPFVLLPGGTDILITSKKSLLRRIIIKYVIRKADIIHADAEIIKKEILDLIPEYPEERFRIFPQLGIDLEKFNPLIPVSSSIRNLGWNGKKVLIMTRSMINPVYGIEYFLSALIPIIKTFPDVRVIFCGDGPYRNGYMKFVKKNKIEDYVFFAGHVENGNLAEFLNAADIYVSSSLSDGTPLSLLEAMACKLPVVVTDVPAVIEWVRDGYNGYVVPRRNSEILAKKIIDLLQNDNLRKTMAENNYRIAMEHIDINKNFVKLQQIFNELSGNN